MTGLALYKCLFELSTKAYSKYIHAIGINHRKNTTIIIKEASHICAFLLMYHHVYLGENLRTMYTQWKYPYHGCTIQGLQVLVT